MRLPAAVVGKHRRPLGIRLTLWHSALFLASALLLLGSTYVFFRGRALANERDAIAFRLRLYVFEYQRGGAGAVKRLAELPRNWTQRPFYVRLADARNRTLYERTAPEWEEFHTERLSAEPMPPPGTREWQTLETRSDADLLIAAERLPDGALMQVGRSTEELDALLKEYRRSALLVLLVFVPASFVGGAFVTSRALRPVNDLAEAARTIVSTGRLDARVPSPESRDELETLVQVFNEMLSRIDTLVRSLRDSLDNVAHDLRTPLTRLRARAQNALIAAEENPAGCAACEAAFEALADCVEEAERVAAMLNTLMEISEAEAGAAALRKEPVLLAAIVREAVAAFAEVAEHRGIVVKTHVSHGLEVLVDPTAFSRAVANVLDNAIKYAPHGGWVDVDARAVQNLVEVRVRDNGAGISPGDLPRIWERLFRGDRSRSRRGLGLGLSFVKAIVEAHGGSARAESEAGRGTTIIMSLPGA